MSFYANEIKNIITHINRLRNYLEDADAELRDGRVDTALEYLKNSFQRANHIAKKIFEVSKKAERSLTPKSVIMPADFESKISLSEPQCYFQSEHIFQCKISLPPLMKQSELGIYYADIISKEIQKKLVAEAHKQHHRFKKICVIFVNNMDENQRDDQPYYDNDNILIKHILDSIISYVAYDDATLYCSNIYTYDFQPESGFTIFVVEEGHLFEWCVANSQVVFAKEILQKSPQKNN